MQIINGTRFLIYIKSSRNSVNSVSRLWIHVYSAIAHHQQTYDGHVEFVTDKLALFSLWQSWLLTHTWSDILNSSSGRNALFSLLSLLKCQLWRSVREAETGASETNHLFLSLSLFSWSRMISREHKSRESLSENVRLTRTRYIPPTLNTILVDKSVVYVGQPYRGPRSWIFMGIFMVEFWRYVKSRSTPV